MKQILVTGDAYELGRVHHKLIEELLEKDIEIVFVSDEHVGQHPLESMLDAFKDIKPPKETLPPPISNTPFYEPFIKKNRNRR